MSHQPIQTTVNFLQIVALLVAAVWGVTLWYQQVFPLLSPNVDAHATVHSTWSDSAGGCLTEFRVSLENRGLRSVRVESVPYTVERSPAPTFLNGENFKPVKVPLEVVEEGDFEVLQGPLKPREIWYESRRYLISPSDPYHYSIQAKVLAEGGMALQEVSTSSVGCNRPASR